MPRKRDFRMRAHINPLSETRFPFPKTPDYLNMRIHYPLFFGGTQEENEKIHGNTDEYPITYETV